jgi:hypothetical protein
LIERLPQFSQTTLKRDRSLVVCSEKFIALTLPAGPRQ